ncbi:MAG TPA: hypothetical protein VKG65_12560 [Terriglobales bacterium]|nr:hypothetical protein [Terriglobales bacterium]
MVRRKHQLGFALLLAAGLCLPAHESAAQSTPPKPSARATAAHRQKTRPHPKKPTPDPPAPQTPEPPPTLEQTPPTPPQVTYNNGQLTIISKNATLSQVLRSVQSQTGASIEMPSGASSERVVGQLGPGQPRDVLSSLLNGTKFNYIIVGVTGNPGAVQKVILTTPKLASTVNTAQNNAVPPPEEPQDEEDYSEPEPQPQAPPPSPPQVRHRPVMPGRLPEAMNQQQQQPQQPQQPPTPDNSGDNPQPSAAKTPEQLLQELQQMQQQQQQLQEQLNPANRSPQQ